MHDDPCRADLSRFAFSGADRPSLTMRRKQMTTYGSSCSLSPEVFALMGRSWGSALVAASSDNGVSLRSRREELRNLGSVLRTAPSPHVTEVRHPVGERWVLE